MNLPPLLIALGCLWGGYQLGRLRPIKRLVRWNWKRVILGVGKHIGEPDAYLYAVLHPVQMARGLKWSPWYQPPPEPVNLDEIFFQPKEKASDRADS